LPDESDLAIETDLPPALTIEGEKRYTSLILQNLLENARKYNRPGGTHPAGGATRRASGRWSRSATPELRFRPRPKEHIFERFHRAAVGREPSATAWG